MARITPLAEAAGDPSWASLAGLGSTALVVALLAGAVVALGPGLTALLRLIDRLPSMPRQIDAWADEDAPRDPEPT